MAKFALSRAGRQAAFLAGVTADARGPSDGAGADLPAGSLARAVRGGCSGVAHQRFGPGEGPLEAVPDNGREGPVRRMTSTLRKRSYGSAPAPWCFPARRARRPA